jgi:hypothetical protein
VHAWEQRLVQVVLALGRPRRGSTGYGRPSGILHIFRLAERLLERGHHTHSLRPGGLVRYELLPLPRAALPLRGQAPVRRGEPVIALHFDNPTIARLAAATSGSHSQTWRMARIGSADLHALADLARNGAIPPGLRAVWAETIFYPALARYGFAVRPARRGLRTPFARLYLLTLIAMYGRPRAGAAAALRSRPLELGEAWMSLDDLRRRFPPDAAPPVSALPSPVR